MIVIMKDGGVTMEVYNKNRDKNNSMHDEIREQNAKLKDAPLKEKLAYFNEYYLKTTLVVLAILLLVGSIAYSMLTAPSDTAFAAFFYNTTGKPPARNYSTALSAILALTPKSMTPTLTTRCITPLTAQT